MTRPAKVLAKNRVLTRPIGFEQLEPRTLLAVLVQYDFTGEPGDQASTPPDYVDPCITATNVTRGSEVATPPYAYPNSIASTGWATSYVRDDSDYFSLGTWTPDPGCSMTLSTFRYAVRTSTYGPRKYEIRYSFDNFATSSLFTSGDTYPGSTSNVTITPMAGQFNNLTTQIELRLYGFYARSSSAEWCLLNNTQASPYGLVVEGTVTGGNQSPTAEAGGPYSVNEGSSVTLSAAGSNDPDGSIVSYLWDLDNDGQYDDGSGVTVSFSRTADGVYTVGVKVTDDDGAFDTDTTTVTVSNVAPTANAGGPYTCYFGQQVTLDASASTDPGLDIVSYAWDTDNDGQYDDVFGATVHYTPPAAGTFAVAVKVTDDDGAARTDSAQLTVNTPIPGDANWSGTVDAADASILGAHWQQQAGATWGMGDFNGDFKVNDKDAAILAAHWEQSVGLSEAAELPASSPQLIGAPVAASLIGPRPASALPETRRRLSEPREAAREAAFAEASGHNPTRQQRLAAAWAYEVARPGVRQRLPSPVDRLASRRALDLVLAELGA